MCSLLSSTSKGAGPILGFFHDCCTSLGLQPLPAPTPKQAHDIDDADDEAEEYEDWGMPDPMPELDRRVVNAVENITRELTQMPPSGGCFFFYSSTDGTTVASRMISRHVVWCAWESTSPASWHPALPF